MLNLSSLKSNWLNLFQESNADLQYKEAVFNNLVNAYCARTRYYHSLKHIQDLLNWIEEAKAIADCLAVLEFAAWFHDYVYDPRAKDNEINSAVYADKTLRELEINSNLIQSVKQIILSTQKHRPLTNSIDNLIFLDIDLAILGASPTIYQEYARQIRQEYQWLSYRNYQRGRRQVLVNFMAREKIYYTDYFYRRLEQSARANLAAEIALYS